jgi:hypothetical protein
MKNWLRKKLHSFLYPEEREANLTPKISRALKNGANIATNKLIGSHDSNNNGLDDHQHNPIRFNVYSANGGKIVETKIYDEKMDRWISSLHVIDSSENFGDAVGKIVFMELLKKG